MQADRAEQQAASKIGPASPPPQQRRWPTTVRECCMPWGLDLGFAALAQLEQMRAVQGLVARPPWPSTPTGDHPLPCAQGALWARLRERLRSLHVWQSVSHDMAHRLLASNVGRMGSDRPASGSEHGIPRGEMIIKQQGCVIIKNKSNQIAESGCIWWSGVVSGAAGMPGAHSSPNRPPLPLPPTGALPAVSRA